MESLFSMRFHETIQFLLFSIDSVGDMIFHNVVFITADKTSNFVMKYWFQTRLICHLLLTTAMSSGDICARTGIIFLNCRKILFFFIVLFRVLAFCI